MQVHSYIAVLVTNNTLGDYQVGWFRQMTLLHSDLIKQVSAFGYGI